jgi:rubredoxin
MSIFDTINSTLTCPRCSFHGDFTVEAFLPCSNQISYKLNDAITNVTRNKMPDSGIYEGYAECPSCKKDFFLLIHIENKVIASVKIDENKKSYIS